MNTICIYHDKCIDGFGAAWAVQHLLRDRDIKFYPANYGMPPPDVTDKTVIIVDFSYKRDIMIDIIRKAKRTIVLDHHKSSAKELSNMPEDIMDKMDIVFDMYKSGAILAWNYFTAVEPPPLLSYIEDYDLWSFKLPDTKKVISALFSYPYDFSVWTWLMNRSVHSFVDEGTHILRKFNKDVDELIETMTIKLEIDGHIVPAVNAPIYYASDIGNRLCQGNPFAVCYYDIPEGRKYSLRSTDEGLDVSEVAVKFGGGGHRNASSFVVPFSKLPLFDIKD